MGVTVREAGELWIQSAERNGLERATIALYRQHLAQHIVPHIGAVKLSQLSAPMVRAFEDKLSHSSSPAMVRKVRNSLSGILADAQERGLVAHNVVRDLRAKRRHGKERQAERRERGKLKVGVDIPSPDEIRAILAAAQGRWRPLLVTAIFCGLRASELRGLRWADVDLKKCELHVRQRADRFNDVGKPKSEAGERTIPIPPGVLGALKAWKLECPKGTLDLVFPNGAGRIENHGNIVTRGLWPIEIAAGVADIAKDDDGKVVYDDDGKPVMRARYTGLHSFRHFFASWCINRKVDGGLELPAKLVQERLGHSTVVLTLDRYGHLFPRGDDSAELAAAEAKLFGR
jgi:integrase